MKREKRSGVPSGDQVRRAESSGAGSGDGIHPLCISVSSVTQVHCTHPSPLLLQPREESAQKPCL